MVLENASDDREAEAGALLACRDVRLEQAAAVLLGQADSVIDHVDDDLVALASRPDADAAAAELGRRNGGNGFGRVLDDVGEALRDQPAVELRRHRVPRGLDGDVDIGSGPALP